MKLAGKVIFLSEKFKKPLSRLISALGTEGTGGIIPEGRELLNSFKAREKTNKKSKINRIISDLIIELNDVGKILAKKKTFFDISKKERIEIKKLVRESGAIAKDGIKEFNSIKGELDKEIITAIEKFFNNYDSFITDVVGDITKSI